MGTWSPFWIWNATILSKSRNFCRSMICSTLSFFSTKTHICHQLGLPNDSQIHPKPGPGPIRCWFSAPSVFDSLRSVFDRFYFLRLFKNSQKTEQKQSLEKTMKNMSNSAKKLEIFRKWPPNSVQMGELILGNSTLAPLVAPLAPQTVFLSNKCSQSAPKVIPGLQKWLQKGSQSSKNGSQIIQHSKKIQHIRILARRTARSD